MLLGNLAAGGNEFLIGHVVLRTASNEVDTELSRNYHQRVGNIVAGIAHEDHLQAFVAAEVLFDGEHVGEHLSWVELGGKTIPHGNTSIAAQVLNDVLVETAILDTVEHASKHLGGVLERLLVAHL